MPDSNRKHDNTHRALGIAAAVIVAAIVAVWFWPARPSLSPAIAPPPFETYFAALHPECAPERLKQLASEALPAKAQECKDSQAEERQNHRQLAEAFRSAEASDQGLWLTYGGSKIGIIQAALTTLALFATAWAAWAAADAARAAQDSLTDAQADAKEQTKRFNRQLALAKETAYRQQRPYVGILELAINVVHDSRTNVCVAAELHVVWRNAGQTPTRQLESGIHYRLFRRRTLPPDFDFPDEGNERSSKHVSLPPGHPLRSVEVVTADDLRKVHRGTHCLYYWAWVEYGDQLDRKARHRTETCSRVDVLTFPMVGAPQFATTLHTTFNGADEDAVYKPGKAPKRSAA